MKLVRLAYVEEPPLLYPSHIGNAENAATRILSQKKHDWAYEREWRLLGSEGKVQLGRTKAIKEISFGLRVEDAHRKRIMEAIDKLDIVAYQMEVSEYGIEWEKLEKASKKGAKTKLRTKVKKPKKKA